MVIDSNHMCPFLILVELAVRLLAIPMIITTVTMAALARWTTCRSGEGEAEPFSSEADRFLKLF